MATNGRAAQGSLEGRTAFAQAGLGFLRLSTEKTRGTPRHFFSGVGGTSVLGGFGTRTEGWESEPHSASSHGEP